MKLKSIAALYMASPAWKQLSEGSRAIYERALKPLKPFLEMDADKITRPMIVDFKDRYYDQGGVCRGAIAMLSNILEYGYDRGHCNHNHAARMKHMPKTTPRPRWTEEELQTFYEGAKPHVRAAFLTTLLIGQRRSDVYHLRKEAYDGKCIRLLQQKTRNQSPTFLQIPVHPILKAELDALPESDHPYLLSNAYGHPWTKKALTAAITATAKKLGIEGKTIHGLRKTTAAKLAEIGCPPHLIQSITGHRSLKEVMLYTAEADQKRMAKEAMERWEHDSLNARFLSGA